MRLIDADKLRDRFSSIADTSIWCAFCNEVNKAPTVDLLDDCSMVFKSIIHNRHGEISKQTENELFKDIDMFIADMKANCFE